MAGSLSGVADLQENFAAEDIAEVISAYRETCSSCVIEHGGQVARYAGESLLAYFPPDRTDAAISACVDAVRGFAGLRSRQNPLFRSVSGGFGLAVGSVIEGNGGSSVKMDYTTLGQAVQAAIGLESLSRKTGFPVVISDAVRKDCRNPWPFKTIPESTLEGWEEARTIHTLEGGKS